MAIPEVKASPAVPPAPQRAERIPDPCIVVIFGASGDLTKRKLLPALYHLEQSGFLPEEFRCRGCGAAAAGGELCPDMKDGIVSGGGVEASDPKLEPFIATDSLSRDELRRRRGIRGAEGTAGQASTRSSAPRAIGCFTWRRRRSTFADIINSLGKHGMDQPAAAREQLGADDHREAVRA